MILTVEFIGADRVEAVLSRFDQIPEQAAVAVGVLVENQTRDRFNTKEGPNGPWPKWAASTAKRKKRGFSLMVESGRLAQSPTHSVSGLSVLAGTNVEYAVYHQGGTKHMPAREIVGLSADNQDEIEERLLAMFKEAL
jgi:phage gpG-like protein